MFDTTIFDSDGVILDGESLHCQVLKCLEIKLSDKKYVEKYLGLADKDMFTKLLYNKGYAFSAGIMKN